MKVRWQDDVLGSSWRVQESVYSLKPDEVAVFVACLSGRHRQLSKGHTLQYFDYFYFPLCFRQVSFRSSGHFRPWADHGRRKLWCYSGFPTSKRKDCLCVFQYILLCVCVCDHACCFHLAVCAVYIWRCLRIPALWQASSWPDFSVTVWLTQVCFLRKRSACKPKPQFLPDSYTTHLHIL